MVTSAAIWKILYKIIIIRSFTGNTWHCSSRYLIPPLYLLQSLLGGFCCCIYGWIRFASSAVFISDHTSVLPVESVVGLMSGPSEVPALQSLQNTPLWWYMKCLKEVSLTPKSQTFALCLRKVVLVLVQLSPPISGFCQVCVCLSSLECFMADPFWLPQQPLKAPPQSDGGRANGSPLTLVLPASLQTNYHCHLKSSWTLPIVISELKCWWQCHLVLSCSKDSSICITDLQWREKPTWQSTGTTFPPFVPLCTADFFFFWKHALPIWP